MFQTLIMICGLLLMYTGYTMKANVTAKETKEEVKPLENEGETADKAEDAAEDAETVVKELKASKKKVRDVAKQNFFMGLIMVIAGLIDLLL